MRYFKIGCVFFITVMILLTLSICFTKETQAVNTANKASDFTLQGVNGEKIILSQILKDKKAVLVFWASWCPYCVNEVPDVEKFYKDNQNKIAVIGVNLQESKEKAASFIKKMGITYPIALDADGKVGQLYNVRGIPTVVAIDKDENIIYYGHSIKEMMNKINF